MNPTPKKLVGKGAYASGPSPNEPPTPTMKAVGMQVGTKMLEKIFCFLTMSCAMIGIMFIFVACSYFGTYRGERFALGSVIFILAAFAWGRFGTVFSQKAHAFMAFDLVNTADLPIEESLVRASERPATPQNDVLLRSATETQARHAEQLLRPS